MSCPTSGAPQRDALYSNMTVSGVINACRLATNQFNAEVYKTILLKEDPVEVGYYLITPNYKMTVVRFEEPLVVNQELTIDIDSSKSEIGDMLLFQLEAFVFDGSDPVAVRVDTPYPPYYYSGGYTTPFQGDNDYFAIPPPSNYNNDDPPQYIPGVQVLPFWFDGEVWSAPGDTFIVS